MRSPIIIQNSSNPSSWKNLDVRPYKVLLLTCLVNCTMGTPTSQLCSVVQWSVHWAPSRMTWVLVLAGARRCALEMCRKKKMRALLLGLAKSIYYKYSGALGHIHSNLHLPKILGFQNLPWCFPLHIFFHFLLHIRQSGILPISDEQEK